MLDKKKIMQLAADMAKDISACAIIIMSADIPHDVETDIPILVAAPTPTFAASPIFEAENTHEIKDDEKRLQTTTKTITFKAATGSDLISDASAMAFISNFINGDRIVGLVSNNETFTIVVHNLKDNPLVQELKACTERIDLKVLQAVLHVALDLGMSGREGKSVGTAFIIADTEEVMKRSHQLVLNPYLGHPKEECNILEPLNWETVKEFAQLDGMFVLDSEGYIHASGRYLDVDAREVETVMGLGGRHTSAAAITRDTEAVAVTVSESDGMIRIYKDGIQIIELDPRASKLSLSN